MGCSPSQHTYSPSVDNALKNEVDEQLAQMQEEERTHYKVNEYMVTIEFSHCVY